LVWAVRGTECDYGFVLDCVGKIQAGVLVGWSP